MHDCELKIRIKDGKVLFKTEGVDMTELLLMFQTLDQTIGYEAHRRNVDLEVIKDHMLDLHLEAMQMLTEQIIKEKGEN